jgi:DNA-binding CsgD family transcriptional regulator
MARTPTLIRFVSTCWRYSIEPIAASVLLGWWLLGAAQPIVDYVPMPSETGVTNPYSVLVAAAFAASLAVSRLAPQLSLSIAAIAVAAQLVGWAARFSQTGWVAYLILLATVLALSVHARGGVRIAAIASAVPAAVAISALLNLPSLSLSGEWGLINGHPWGATGLVVGLVVWALAQLIAAVAVWRLPGWVRSLMPGTSEREATPPSTPELDVLSGREREIYLLVARGLTNAEIAAAAHIEGSTVKTHISKLLTKLELGSRSAIIAHAYRVGALVPEGELATR